MSITEEIQPAEFERYATQLGDELEIVCKSSAFRTSPKSCEFLRHIVHHTLHDDTAQLKERLIGILLLGRETAYDTGTDAGVRVRANDVRKRLVAYCKTLDADRRFLFELPTGSYVPRFFRLIPSADPALEENEQDVLLPLHLESGPPLSLQWVAAPTLIALFLCIVCLRWQIAEEHPFTSFWQKVFQDHQVSFYLSPLKTERGEDLVAMRELKAADPLLDLAAKFDARLLLTSNVTTNATASMLISIGPIASALTSSSAAAISGHRLTVEDTPNGRKIFDRGTSGSMTSLSGQAALLTISNGAQRSIQIDGTDANAIEALVKVLCEKDTFPASLADSLQDRTITQVVFPVSPHAQTMIFHEPLPLTQGGEGQLR
ncbi:hypothetical protein [Acidicapsa ligni]|uniref:hypothetical protein n=1 Tax=Acidicapsa ligni TaxID=542300 RepID=UPI0021DFE18A|nr:hypothetical protein [Acidicapsa ligni]